MGTRRLLALQLYGLLLLTTLATALLYLAYDETQRRPAQVRDRAAPAIMDVAVARNALLRAHLTVERALESPVEKTVGTGEEYRTQIAAATRSLSRTADRQVAGENGEDSLETVNALLAAYTDAVDSAVAADREGLAPAYFGAAWMILERSGTGILPRLDQLQRLQSERLAERTSFDGPRRIVWGAAAAALLLLAAALAVVQWQLSRRFPQRLNIWLLAACAVVLACVVPVRAAVHSQRELDSARENLAAVLAIEEKAHGSVRADKEHTHTTPEYLASIDLLTGWQQVALRSSDAVGRRMDGADARRDGRAAIPVGGVAAGALILTGLLRHSVQYRFRRS